MAYLIILWCVAGLMPSRAYPSIGQWYNGTQPWLHNRATIHKRHFRWCHHGQSHFLFTLNPEDDDDWEGILNLRIQLSGWVGRFLKYLAPISCWLFNSRNWAATFHDIITEGVRGEQWLHGWRTMETTSLLV